MAELPSLRPVSSRDNPGFKALKKAVGANASYRSSGWVWLEGDHLCRAALQRGSEVLEWVISESFLTSVTGSIEFFAIKNAAIQGPGMVLPDALMAQLCLQDARATIACRVALPKPKPLRPDAATLVLDRVQDAGNAGAMLRCAAAFGYTQVLALAGTAALWSPKVLRSAMGAHFGLSLYENASAADVRALRAAGLSLLATSSHQGELLHRAQFDWPHAWLMGNEGEGLSAELQAVATQHLRIAQPGGEESLNVATAAAICMHTGALAPRRQ